MLEKIEDQIIKQIKGKKIKPRSRTWFSSKRLLVWFLTFVFVVLGAVSVSLLITVLRFGDFDIYRLINQNFFVFVILVFPYFWLLLYFLFLFFSFWRLRRSQYGYRYRRLWLWLSFLLASLVLGVILEGVGFGRSAENYLADNFSGYRKLNYMRGIWDNPEKGMLSGEIVAIGDNLLLEDFSGTDWQLDLSVAQINPMVKLDLGNKIKVVGQIIDSGRFLVKEIRPWGCGCTQCQKTGADCGCGQSDTCQSGSCGQ